MKEIICTAAGIAGAAIAAVFGGWNASLGTLMICMAADYLTGLIVAGVFKASSKTPGGGLESKVGWKGLCRKAVILMFILLAHRLDMAVGTTYIRDAVTIGFITNELISLIENAGIMGVPMPESLKKALEILKDMEDSSDGDH
ncbi:MAG: phage holin family protein [Oscillospiraceae bacterium]|nr:phage holin family protein [Oscillospiraceae bacterium]